MIIKRKKRQFNSSDISTTEEQAMSVQDGKAQATDKFLQEQVKYAQMEVSRRTAKTMVWSKFRVEQLNKLCEEAKAEGFEIDEKARRTLYYLAYGIPLKNPELPKDLLVSLLMKKIITSKNDTAVIKALDILTSMEGYNKGEKIPFTANVKLEQTIIQSKDGNSIRTAVTEPESVARISQT